MLQYFVVTYTNISLKLWPRAIYGTYTSRSKGL